MRTRASGRSLEQAIRKQSPEKTTARRTEFQSISLYFRPLGAAK
jgi:hypothetical protein